jgi:hypothetical protein
MFEPIPARRVSSVETSVIFRYKWASSPIVKMRARATASFIVCSSNQPLRKRRSRTGGMAQATINSAARARNAIWMNLLTFSTNLPTLCPKLTLSFLREISLIRVSFRLLVVFGTPYSNAIFELTVHSRLTDNSEASVCLLPAYGARLSSAASSSTGKNAPPWKARSRALFASRRCFVRVELLNHRRVSSRNCPPLQLH